MMIITNLIMFSCDSSNCEQFKLFSDRASGSPEYMLIIPASGCNDCINKSLEFGNTWCTHDDLEVFIQHYDEKIVNLMAYERGLDLSCVSILENPALLNFVSVNPVILYIDECRRIELTPHNIQHALSELGEDLLGSDSAN